MTTEALNNFKFAGGSKSAYLAEPAAVGSRANMADIEFVKENKPKMAGMSKFFNVCDDADVQSFRSSCQHGFNKLIVQGGENYYLLPEAVYDEATKMEASLDTENGKKQSKETRMEKISKFYTKALSSMSQQILGMLVPGQVEMISRQQEDEEKVSTSMSSIGETLETILAKFEFYATEHKKMNTTLKESVNAQKDLVAKVDLYRQENEKLRQELALKEFNRQNRPDSDQAGYIGMRDPKHAHNLENGFPFDRNFPGQHELAKQLKKNEKDKKKSGKPGKPVGLSNKDMRSSSNYGVTKDYGLGADLVAGVGARGDQQRSNHQNGGQPEDSEGFKLPKGRRRNKARGNTSQETEAERRTNGEIIAAKELIIHNIESQDPLNYSREKEAELVQEVFEELGVKHLKQFGVDVNLETDIWSHIRLTGHWEAKPENKEGPNGRGCAPIKVRLMSEKI